MDKVSVSALLAVALLLLRHGFTAVAEAKTGERKLGLGPGSTPRLRSPIPCCGGKRVDGFSKRSAFRANFNAPGSIVGRSSMPCVQLDSQKVKWEARARKQWLISQTR
jgi:hypothetical protein